MVGRGVGVDGLRVGVGAGLRVGVGVGLGVAVGVGVGVGLGVAVGVGVGVSVGAAVGAGVSVGAAVGECASVRDSIKTNELRSAAPLPARSILPDATNPQNRTTTTAATAVTAAASLTLFSTLSEFFAGSPSIFVFSAARIRAGAVKFPHFYPLSAKNAERCANCTTFSSKGQIKLRGGLYSEGSTPEIVMTMLDSNIATDNACENR